MSEPTEAAAANGGPANDPRVVEALVECLDWIRSSDIYDDQQDGATRWIVDGTVRAQPPIPGDSYSGPEGVQAAIDEVYDLVARAEAVISTTEAERARARSQIRRRSRE